MGRFDQKAILVTGGTRGIGRATVDRFVAEGACVLASGRDQDRLAEIDRAHGHSVVTAAVALDDLQDVRSLVHKAIDVFGALDVLVNCAGISIPEPILKVTEETWRRTFSLNLDAAFFASQEAARYMVKHGGGTIINVSSIDAYVAESAFVHYCASKAALSMVTKAFAYELGGSGIRCNALAAGITWTSIWKEVGDPTQTYQALCAQIPIGRVASADEQARVIAFLASDDASFINGETIIADGGQTCGYWSGYEETTRISPALAPMPEMT